MDDGANILRRVELSSPVLLAGWPGMGRVANLAVAFLARQLDARKLAEIAPDGFFRTSGVQIRGGVFMPPVQAESVFSFVRHVRPEGDLLLFSGSDQPLPGREWDYARKVVDQAKIFGVRRIYTTAALVSPVHHKAPCGVFGVATRDELTGDLLRHEVTLVRDGVIGGMNGLLLAAANEQGLEGVCLLGEVPQYITEMENPKAVLAVLRVFRSMTGLLVDLDPLEGAVRSFEDRLDLVLEQLSGQEDVAAAEDVENSESSQGGSTGPIN